MLSMGIESGPDLTIFWCRKYESFVTIPAILWCAPCPNFKDKASNCTPLWLGELHYVLVLRPRQQAQEHRHYGWAAFYAPLFASVWFSSSYAFLPCDCLEVIGTFQCLINDIHFRGGPLFYSRGGPSKLVFLRCSLPFGLSFLRLALLGHVIAPAFIQPRQSTAHRQNGLEEALDPSKSPIRGRGLVDDLWGIDHLHYSAASLNSTSKAIGEVLIPWEVEADT
jgi:hypothetical protein